MSFITARFIDHIDSSRLLVSLASRSFVKAETMDGSNCVDCANCAKRTPSLRGVYIKQLPKILTLQVCESVYSLRCVCMCIGVPLLSVSDVTAAATVRLQLRYDEPREVERPAAIPRGTDPRLGCDWCGTNQPSISPLLSHVASLVCRSSWT